MEANLKTSAVSWEWAGWLSGRVGWGGGLVEAAGWLRGWIG